MNWKISARLRWLRRAISRSEWSVRLLGLPRSRERSDEPGLILIQIDGLSKTQLQRALEHGRMPYLNRLLARESYTLHSMYSGLPSTTPSVQGELFYGIRPAVPAFSFLSHRHGRVIKMFDPDPVADIQRELESRGRGLLEGGSAYSNVYSGGAAEAHFCAATFGFSHLIQSANPFKFLVWLAMYFGSLLRTLVLLPVELVLAIVDFFRGALAGHSLAKELKFVPTRVLICILLRELITAGAMIDAARGLPIIHLNFLGYDEQAHRRGPGSEFAHWTLKGIDDAIRRIHGAARRSVRREYDVWVYSDHGQEHTVPYPVENGRTLQAAVAEIFSGFASPVVSAPEAEAGVRSQRVRYLGEKRAGLLLPRLPAEQTLKDGTQYTLAAMGPIGHINFGKELDRSLLPQLAQKLVDEAGVPAVMMMKGADRAMAWNSEGQWDLPRDIDAIIGSTHPYRRELKAEILELCGHPDSGDLVLLGFRPGGRPLSFPIENGAHAGPGPLETEAFALVPFDAPLRVDPERGYLRPFSLRDAAFRHLGRSEEGYGKEPLPLLEPPPRTVRVMTYDVSGCQGKDGTVSPRRIARVIARSRPDIICLQQLKGLGREGRDQAAEIADGLKKELHLLTSLRIEEGRWGEAVLSRFPLTDWGVSALEVLEDGVRSGTGGAQGVIVDVGSTRLRLINASLSRKKRTRERQVEMLFGEDWVTEAADRLPVLLCIDGGTALSPRAQRRMEQLVGKIRQQRPERRGLGRRGLLYGAAGIDVVQVEVPADDLVNEAAEYRPMVIEIRLPDSKTANQETSRSC